MKRFIPTVAAGLALIGTSTATLAATQIGEYLSLSGFGTVGAVQTNSDQGKFGRDRQPGGADTNASFDVDSNLGLQATGTATSWLSGTVQMLYSKRNDDHLEPKIEWAFVTVKPLDGLSLRAGRMAAPVFAVSDSRNVGYANTWVRAPNEVYALNVFRNMEGVDVTYRKSLGPVAVSATVLGGKTEFKGLGGTSAKGEDLRGVNLQLETDWATFRLGRATTDVKIGTAAADPYEFTGVGVVVDHNDIVVQAEYVQRRSDKQPAAVSADGWYVMGGYRFGAFLPYAIVSETEPRTPTNPIHLSATQKTQAIGLRWDAFSSAAIKFQVDRIDTENSKGISFTTPLQRPRFPGAPAGSSPVTESVTAYSIAVDFTF